MLPFLYILDYFHQRWSVSNDVSYMMVFWNTTTLYKLIIICDVFNGLDHFLGKSNSIVGLYCTASPRIWCFLLKIWIPFSFIINLNVSVWMASFRIYNQHISIAIATWRSLFISYFFKPRACIFCTIYSCPYIW